MLRYSLSPERISQMLDEQGGQCAVCSGVLGKYHIDHDHACCPGPISCGGCVRGLLCARCNIALGWFNDSAESMKAAIKYLER